MTSAPKAPWKTGKSRDTFSFELGVLSWELILEEMATINRFEDLQIWQKARELCRLIHQITQGKKFAQDYFLKKQILSSSGSTMDNIAEGFERGGNKEFIQFLAIAKGSAAEVRSQLYRAIDQEYIDQPTFDQLYRLSEEISKMTGSFIDYLKQSTHKGRKFHQGKP